MRIKVSTKVTEDYQTVFRGFDKSLFLKLKPPFPPVELLRFDGMDIGDEVHLDLWMPFRRQIWISRITDFAESDKEIYFVDEGVKLPFFLSGWKHRHRVVKDGDGAIIIDDIEFSGPLGFTGLLLYPALLMQFWYRKPIYRREFAKR